jgi:hypothetical protein
MKHVISFQEEMLLDIQTIQCILMKA